MATILIATDDSGLYDILSAEITGEGHDTIWAVDGREAVEMALEQQPNLVLLDAHLPVHDGYAVCQLLRADPEVPARTPILILADEDLNVHKLEQSGATDQFPKTHLAQELIDAVVKHLGPLAGPGF